MRKNRGKPNAKLISFAGKGGSALGKITSGYAVIQMAQSTLLIR
jgi:hypothetical protein